MGSETVSVSLLGPSSQQINNSKKTRILITVSTVIVWPNFISFVYALFVRHLDVFLQTDAFFPLETLSKRL